MKVLGNELDLKSRPKDCRLLGYFENDTLLLKLLWMLFRQLLKKFGNFLHSASGHTAYARVVLRNI